MGKNTGVDASVIKADMLIIGARMDQTTPVSLTRKIADKYKSIAKYKEFSNHGHSIILEPGWQVVADYIFRWLENPNDFES